MTIAKMESINHELLQIMENPAVHSPGRPQGPTFKPMNAITPSKAKGSGRGAAPAYIAPKRPYMRAALEKAIFHIVKQGKTQREAAEREGMTEAALSRALKRPPIAAWVEYLKSQETIDAISLKARANAMAIQRGIDLMFNAQSEAVQARMVELFAGEAKTGTQVNVNIGAKANGYEYLRPGARVIEIRAGDGGPQDTASSGEIGQGLDSIDDAETVDPTNDPTD